MGMDRDWIEHLVHDTVKFVGVLIVVGIALGFALGYLVAWLLK